MKWFPLWTYLRRRTALAQCDNLDRELDKFIRGFPRHVTTYISERDLKKVRDEVKLIRRNVETIRTRNFKGKLFSPEPLKSRVGAMTLRFEEIIGRDEVWTLRIDTHQRECRDLQRLAGDFHPRLRDKVADWTNKCHRSAGNALEARTIPDLGRYLVELERGLENARDLVRNAEEAHRDQENSSQYLVAAKDTQRVDPSMSEAALEHFQKAERETTAGNYDSAVLHYKAGKKLLNKLGDRDRKRKEIVVASLRSFLSLPVKFKRNDESLVSRFIPGEKLYRDLLKKYSDRIEQVMSAGSSPEFWELWDQLRPMLFEACDEACLSHGRDSQKLIQRSLNKRAVFLHWHNDLDWRELGRFARAVSQR